jgi:hypothetical protein
VHGYICTATNDMGSVSATATLIIQGIKIFSTIEFVIVNLIGTNVIDIK